MLAAVRILGNSISSVSCFAHTFNLVIKKAISSVADLVTVRTKYRSIVTFFKQSYLAKDKLFEMQNLLKVPNHKLILEVDTRWNLTYEMISRLLEQRQAVTSALTCFTEYEESLTAGEW